MDYQHLYQDGNSLPLPVGKVVCVGRNYADHAKELNNPVPDQPLLFIKPATAVVSLQQSIKVPTDFGPCHFEAELAVLVGERLTSADPEQARRAIAGIGLGLDLTLRQLQDELKAKGHPWEKAKAFDGSCPLSPFVEPDRLPALEELCFSLSVNGSLRQSGHAGQMLTPVPELLAYASRFFTLMPGDVVLTGTPAGVGVIGAGDRLRLALQEQYEFVCEVC